MQRFNPAARKTYLALCLGLILVLMLTYALAGVVDVNASIVWVSCSIYCVVFVIGVVATLIATKMTVYEISDAEVLVRRGVLNREEKVISFDKIDNISLKRTLDDRIFGLASVYIDTPASPEYEMIMKGLSLGDAKKIVEALRKSAVERQERSERREAPKGKAG